MCNESAACTGYRLNVGWIYQNSSAPELDGGRSQCCAHIPEIGKDVQSRVALQIMMVQGNCDAANSLIFWNFSSMARPLLY
jgi:hypothetical protein